MAECCSQRATNLEMIVSEKGSNYQSSRRGAVEVEQTAALMP